MLVQFALAAALLQEPSVDQILDKVRTAIGYSQYAQGRGVEVKGSSVYLGLEMPYSFLFEPSGRFLFDIKGTLGQKRGWDGSQTWEADSSGSTAQMFLETLDLQNAFSWTLTNRWLDPESPYEISLDNDQPSVSVYTLKLQRKEGELLQHVSIDALTHLPIMVEFNSTVGEHKIYLKNWKKTDLGTFAHKIETDDLGVKGSYTVESISEMPIYKRSPFTMPIWSVNEDTVYDDSKKGAIITKRAPSGHILVKPTIDGKDVGWFILDSGAGGMVIDKSVAERLGGERFGEMVVAGVGGTEVSGYYKFDDFKLGPATVEGMLFIELDLEEISDLFGVELGGIVGYDFFRRTTVIVDQEETKVEIYDPRNSDRKLNWIPLVLDNRHAVIEAEFEGGHTGLFRIDTGANGTVSFNRPTVIKHRLLDERATMDVQQGGVGGSVASKMGKLKYFEIAGKRWENIQAMFSTSDEGLHGGSYLDGNLGHSLLKAFRLVFDYPNGRIAMVKK